MAIKRGQLVVALDVATLEEVKALIDTLSSVVDIFKIGSQLFTACGPAAVRFILAREKKAFLDLKYHDIPHTVGEAVKAAVGLGVAVPTSGKKENQCIFMYTVHTLGGKAMLQAAVQASQEKSRELDIPKPLVVGITVLTSEEKQNDIHRIVLDRALLAKESGCDGVVASVNEAKIIREKLGKDFITVTPGIRPAGADNDDQKRIATPREAVLNGSHYLVVGRPIIAAGNPLESAKKILEEIGHQ